MQPDSAMRPDPDPFRRRAQAFGQFPANCGFPDTHQADERNRALQPARDRPAT